MHEDNREGFHKSRRSLLVFSLDLNRLPYSVASSELLENKRTEKVHQGATEKERKRAATKDIAGISLEDVKYFDLPIVEALRNLRVGIAVMKRKCRELGIPRWPHRKIKSLDSLICIILEEAERQEQESEDAAVAVTKRKKNVGNRKGEYRKETIHGDTKQNQEIQARCFQEKAQKLYKLELDYLDMIENPT